MRGPVRGPRTSLEHSRRASVPSAPIPLTPFPVGHIIGYRRFLSGHCPCEETLMSYNLGDYSAEVIEHYTNPRNVGEIENPDGIGHVGNPVCGDIMELYIKVNESTIVDAKFKTFGCGAAIATSSMVTEIIKGKTIREALEISNRAVVEALGGLPPIKMHCSVLAEEALKSAIEDYLTRSKGRNDGSKSNT